MPVECEVVFTKAFIVVWFLIYSEDAQKKGFTIIVDARSEKWTNFKSILQVIKVGLIYCCLKSVWINHCYQHCHLQSTFSAGNVVISCCCCFNSETWCILGEKKERSIQQAWSNGISIWCKQSTRIQIFEMHTTYITTAAINAYYMHYHYYKTDIIVNYTYFYSITLLQTILLSSLTKLEQYVDRDQLPENFGGTYNFDPQPWIDRRIVSINLF